MAGIPPALDTDAEDVVWALQTADALWKRRERVDAIVWLRRAAQAAGEADDDDRALALAREAAELADYIARNPQSIPPRSAPPPAEPPTAAEAVDDLLRTSQAPEVGEPMTAVGDGLEASQAPAHARHVPTAAEAHAGMLDPWADGEAPTKERELPRVEAAATPSRSTFDHDEVVTSAPPVARPVPARALPPAVPPPRRPPAPSHGPAAPAAPVAQPAAPSTLGVDLSSVEALSDLPDDARVAFVSAATLHDLANEEEVSSFALALVLEGSVDLTATIVDAPAQRLEAGAVMRARGTLDHVAPVRLVAASERARVATWDENAVHEAFRACPWVEDDLRAAGDRLQAMVGATMGPLGERLDPMLRAQVTSRLSLRSLAEHEVFASRGTLIPGMLVVGAGELELVGDDGAPDGTVLRPGEFLFPNEVLSHSLAPSTVRASKGGALVLFADRNVCQELLVTCPPLLEIFAGG